MPLRVFCPGPVLRLVSSRGVARSLSPSAWLWVACPLVGGPVRRGRSGVQGWLGGGGSCRPRWGRGSVRFGQGVSGNGGLGVALPRAVPLPRLYGHQAGLLWRRSVHGGCGLHTAPGGVRALLSGRGPRGALRGVLVYQRVAGRQAGRLAGAAACRVHCGSRLVTAREGAARGPSGLPSAALGLGRRGHLGVEGGGIFWPGGGGTGPASLGRSPALRRLGGGGAGHARVVQSLCSLPAPWSISWLRRPPGGCRAWLEGLGPGPHHRWIRLCVRGPFVVLAAWHRRAGLGQGPQPGRGAPPRAL